MNEETERTYNSDIRITTVRKFEEEGGLFSINPTEEELERLNEPLLDVKVGYEHPRTQEDVDRDLDYYQWCFSQKAGREVPRDEIEVDSTGIMVKGTTGFIKKLGKPLYIGLDVLHQEAPYVLPKLIEDLRNYEADQNLGDKETILIKEVIAGLKGIVNNKYEDWKPGKDFIDLTQLSRVQLGGLGWNYVNNCGEGWEKINRVKVEANEEGHLFYNGRRVDEKDTKDLHTQSS
jgi:hypothetical protein